MTMQIITRQEAAQQGLSRFFTGKPCKHGHVSERYTRGNQCAVCSNLRAIQYGKENKEATRRRSRKFYDANKELCKLRTVEWQRKNKERHAEKSKRWKQKNKPHLAFKSMQRRKHVRVATPPWANMDSIKLKYVEAQTMGFVSGVSHHVDHIVPLQGETVCGLHVHYNLRAIPATDNVKKGNKHA